MKHYGLAILGLGVMLPLLVGVAIAVSPAEKPIQSVPALLPSVIVEPLDPTLAGEPSQQWRVEVQRRFPRAVIVLVHGGDFVRGEWLVQSSWNHEEHADVVARRFKELYPDRVVVFVSCNPGHLHLGVPGVYYAMDSVWIHPDRNEGPHADDVADPEVVGNIFEFVTDL